MLFFPPKKKEKRKKKLDACKVLLTPYFVTYIYASFVLK